MAGEKGSALRRAAVYADFVCHVGEKWLRFDGSIDACERSNKFMLQRVSFKKLPVGWRVTIVALVGGERKVQFADVESVSGSAGKLEDMLRRPIWKTDRFAPPAPSLSDLESRGVFDKRPETL
jgi:hypothetical protein